MSQDDADKPTTEPPATTEGNTSSAPPDADAAGDESASAEEASQGAPSEAPEPPAEPSMEDKLAASQDATAKMKEKMLRVAADFENYRRRSSREVEEARDRGTQSAIKELLPVFDNLERATTHVDDTADVQSMVKGLEMVHKQFIDVLGKLGIERVAAVGEGFDPNIHESIQYEHSSEHAAGVVMTELQPGYRKGKMLLRPALVVVSRGPAEEQAEAAKADGDDAEGGGGEPNATAEAEAAPAEGVADEAAKPSGDG